MRYYIALIHKEADSDFGVSFPDFPGCVSAGVSLDEAVAMGREALEGHMALMAEDGVAVPEPSSIEAVLADPEGRGGTPVMIPVQGVGARSVRLSITMPEDTLREVDAFAEAKGFTRSGFLASAARQVMRDAESGRSTANGAKPETGRKTA